MLCSNFRDGEKLLGNILILNFLDPNEDAVAACEAAAKVAGLTKAELGRGFAMLQPDAPDAALRYKHRCAVRVYCEKTPYAEVRRQWLAYIR